MRIPGDHDERLTGQRSTGMRVLPVCVKSKSVLCPPNLTDRRNESGPARERKHPDHRSRVASHDSQRPDTECVLSVPFLVVCTLKSTYVKPDPISTSSLTRFRF